MLLFVALETVLVSVGTATVSVPGVVPPIGDGVVGGVSVSEGKIFCEMILPNASASVSNWA